MYKYVFTYIYIYIYTLASILITHVVFKTYVIQGTELYNMQIIVFLII